MSRALERDVEHDDARVVRAHAVQRLLGVVGERDDVDLGPVVEQRAQPEHDHLMVVDQDDRNGERGHHGPLRNPSRAKPDRSGVPISQMVVQRAGPSHPERVRRGRGSARHRENVADVDQLADGPLRPFDGLSGRPGGDRPTAPDLVRRRTSPAARRRRARRAQRRPARAGDERQRPLVGRPRPRPPRARRPRARPAASSTIVLRRPRRARPCARITSRAAVSRSQRLAARALQLARQLLEVLGLEEAGERARRRRPAAS